MPAPSLFESEGMAHGADENEPAGLGRAAFAETQQVGGRVIACS